MSDRSQVTKPSALRLIAHTMKSNAAMVGARVLTARLEEVEQLAAAGATDGAAEKATQIGALYRRLVEDLTVGVG